jgi:hypothetical protein
MRQNYGLFTLFALGGYLAWRNRFRIQQFLESRGVNLPFDISDSGQIGDKVRGVAAKVSGSIEHGLRKSEQTRKAV